ncbi:FMN-dependent NADH-azoreductase [Rhodovulum euryhalinum]|uniref:FMN dependent NADH:quinone oxidoreductase n=1 Tax=Rhodovulum euryhalinum TaxID=35805 RepID=A0A4R2KT50_9RHOB|nr:NAD(P)H-dependent oxidoreductase [Rhodovulum euryhalinum]TCO74246.1 FMN-dependent NADH-azoreductase [Rhodovulum euryhalinum]
MPHTILRIDSSARRDGSVSRALTDRILARLSDDTTRIIPRDLAGGLPLLTADWIGANFTPEADRTEAQRAELALSDALIAELKAADTIVIGLPVYNFGLPAALKAWIDLVARAGVTFRYTEAGPEGLLGGKRVIVAAASGGTPFGSEIDFATRYLTHILGFLGLTDVTVLGADRLAVDADAALAAAHAAVDRLPRAA